MAVSSDKQRKRNAASEVKRMNFDKLANLVKNGWLTPEQACQWMTAIDRLRSIDTQTDAGLILDNLPLGIKAIEEAKEQEEHFKRRLEREAGH